MLIEPVKALREPLLAKKPYMREFYLRIQRDPFQAFRSGDWQSLEFLYLAVHANYQGRGFGTALVESGA